MLNAIEQAFIVDEQARERILHDLDTTFLVEAGAGSGKTTSLVGRMLNLVKTGRTKVQHIAAITFTNKAAAELQTRFRMKLETEARSSSNEVERQRLEAAMQHLNEMFIGTIHSFCGQLLRQRPIEAKLDPAFTELDEQQSSAFRHACWDAYLAHLRDTGQADSIDKLADLGIHVPELQAVYDVVSEYEDVEIFRQVQARPDFDLIRLSLPSMIEEAHRWMPTTVPDPDWDGLQKMIREARWLLRSYSLKDDMVVLRLAKIFDRTIQVTLKRWIDKDQAKEIKEQFEEWRITVLQPFLQRWREYVHPQAIDFVLPAVAYCTSRRLEAALVDFQDLLMKATELLREHAAVRRYFAQRYRFLLVDEFQDTDPIQAEMMFLLTGEEEEENHWRKLLPRPGSLFIVGDPKQSIYRFRRADISIYNEVRSRIELRGESLQLTRNFRSVQAIGQYVNDSFESKFTLPGDNAAIQAPYVKMLTAQPNPQEIKAIHGVYTLTVPGMSRDKKADIAEWDSDRIAEWIAWACTNGNVFIQERGGEGAFLTRPAEPGDFMILLKRREFINLYAEKLERFGIRSDTSGSKVRYDEVFALAQLARCLNDTTDPVALLAVLRGQLFGVSDDALYQYKKAHGSLRLWMLPDAEIVVDRARPCYEALVTLQRYEGWVRRLPAWTALSRLVEDLGVIPFTASQEIGAIRSGTLVKLLQIVQSRTETAASWHELTEYVEQLVDDKSDGLESTSLYAGSGNAVRIMNLHKAKGLEAPIVFMACPCGGRDHDADEHIDRMVDPALGYFIVKRAKDVVAQPAGWETLSMKEREFMHAEEDRLLYVAATRARQLLVVSRYPDKPAIDPWSALADTLDRQPELDLEAAHPVREVARDDSEAIDPAKALAEWSAWLEDAGAPSFERTSVTAQVKDDVDVQLHRPTEGRGMAFGSVVHRLLEAIGNGLAADRLDAFVNAAAIEEGLHEKLIPDALAMVRRVTSSEIWQRGLCAKQRYHEFSFTLTDRSDNGVERIMKGVIDFLFEEEDGWVIVDFKTDLFEEEYTSEFVAYYKPQVEAYVQQWERFGYKVKEAGLYFLEKERYHRI